MAGTEEKKTKKRDPETAPAMILIDATIAALAANVPNAEIMSALRFARAASGYKAPVWRAAADSLTTAAKTAQENGASQYTTDDRQPGYRADAIS